MQNKIKKTVRLLFLGDLVGLPGCALFSKWVPRLKEKYQIDGVIVNGENSAKNGRGISPADVEALKQSGASVITSGNHIWANKKIYELIEKETVLIRPANYPSGCPGKGYTLFDAGGVSVAIVNLQGRVFMREDLECPFRTLEGLLTFLKSKTSLIFVDFHAEATSEKYALAYHFDGKVSGVLGTHTHVQTADARVLPNGTAYITDLGCAAAIDSDLGVDVKVVIDRFLTQMPMRFSVQEKGPMVLSGVWLEADVSTGKTIHIEPVRIIDDEIAR